MNEVCRKFPRIRDLREDSDLTQQKVADYLHCSQSVRLLWIGNNYAILKDSDKTKTEHLRAAIFKASEISKLYFKGTPLEKIKEEISRGALNLTVNDVKLEAYQMSRSSDKTFYIFVKYNDN